MFMLLCMLFGGISKMFVGQISRSCTNKQKDGSKTSSRVTVLVLILNVRLGGGSEDSQTVINQHWQQHGLGTSNFSLPTLTHRKLLLRLSVGKQLRLIMTDKIVISVRHKTAEKSNNFQVAILFMKRIANQVCQMLTTSHYYHVRYVAFNFICNKYLGRT